MINRMRLLALLALSPLAAAAADFSDPDWPCIQRKVENLSPGLMWPQPVERAALDAEARELAATLALRRVSLEEADGYVRAFATRSKPDEARLGGIFLEVFERLANTRRRLMTGIARYSQSQIALSARIEAGRSEIAKLSAADSPDFDRIDTLEEEMDWNERIYLDRSRALTYVCETPVLIEKRAYAIARILQKYLPAP